MTNLSDKPPAVKKRHPAHSPEARAKAAATRLAKKAAADAATIREEAEREKEQQRYEQLLRDTRSVVRLFYDRSSRAREGQPLSQSPTKVIGGVSYPKGVANGPGRAPLTGRAKPYRRRVTMVRFLPGLHLVPLRSTRQPAPLDLLGRLKRRVVNE